MLGEDAIRIRHMLDAAQEAVSFTKGKKRQDLDADRMLALSLIKLILGRVWDTMIEDLPRLVLDLQRMAET